jgi:hypothetical protein
LWLSGERDFLFFFVAGMRGKSFGMQLAREILDGGNDSRRGPIYGVTDDGKMTVADGVETAPAGALSEYVEIILSAIGMGRGKNQEVRLEADNFFETHVRPVLRGVNDGGGAREAQGIGNKRVFAGGDQRVGPNDEENAARWHAVQTLLEIGKMAFEISAKSGARFGDTEDVSEALGGGNDVLHGTRIGAIGRNTEVIESVHGFDEIQTFRYENEIGPQSGYLFETRIDRAADFGFFLRVRGIIAEVRVSDEAILQAESVDCFREAWSKRDDALNGLRDANGAARFIEEFLIDR